MPEPGGEPRRGRDALIESQLDLVPAIARQVAGTFPRHVDREDLVRAGMVGLVEAAARFDVTLGIGFKHYAALRIRGAILDAVRADDWAPRSVRTAARAIDATESALANRLGRTPSTGEIAAAMGSTEGNVAQARHRANRAVVLTLDAFESGDGDDLALGDLLVDHTTPDAGERLEDTEMRGYVRDAVELLPERHRKVIEGYFFGNETTEELAAALGVSISRISQLKSEALEQLRGGLMAQFLGSSLGAELLAPPVRMGRADQRRAAYAKAIAGRSTWRERLEQPDLSAR